MADESPDMDGFEGLLRASNENLDTVGKGSVITSAGEGSSMHWKWRVRFFMAMLAIFSATGGFLFGYDTGVVSGAMLLIDKRFHLTPFWHELIVASTIGAAAVAAASGGLLSEAIGRRPVLIIASLVFTAGAVVMAASTDKFVLLGGRVIVGLGIGLAAMAVPMYIAESAPAEMRGKLVVLNNLFITGGQFVATLIDGAFSYVPHGWRFMLGLAGVPSIIMFFGFLFLPESPRYLVFKGKTVKARKVLNRLRDPSKVHEELKEINDDFEKYKRERLGCMELVRKFMTSRSVLLALLVGCGLQMFQQLGGINTVMYYSASIIEMAGFEASESIWLATIPAFGNFIFTIVGLVLVDRMGRRKLLIISLVGIVFGFLLLMGSFLASNLTSPHVNLTSPYATFIDSNCKFHRCGECVGNSNCGFCNSTETCLSGNSTHYEPTDMCNSTDWHYNSCPRSKFRWLPVLPVVSLFIYIMFFAPGMGPLPWTVNSEIYPTWARSTCIGIATTVNWLFNLLVSLTFLTLANALGQPKTFGLYAGLGFLGLLFVILFVPETKGRKLEEMESLFKQPYFLSLCRRGDQLQCESSEIATEKEPLLNNY